MAAWTAAGSISGALRAMQRIRQSEGIEQMGAGKIIAIVAASLVGIVAVSIITAFVTGDWRWLVVAVAAWLLVRRT